MSTPQSNRGRRYDQNPPGDAGPEYGPKWREYRRRVFQNLMGRTGLIHDIRAFDRGKNRFPKKDEIRIACVSSPITIRTAESVPGEYDLRHVPYRDDCWLVQADNDKIPELLEGERLSELNAALSTDPHVICFGEFAFPPVARQEHPGWNIEGIRTSVARHGAYEAAILERLKKHKRDNEERLEDDASLDLPTPFVHLGSYHCLMTLYNVGVSYPWGSDTSLQDCKITREDFTTEDGAKISFEKIAAPILQRKRYPARKIQEHTRIPATRNFDIYAMPFGKVAMLICSDVIDVNQFLSVVRYNRTSRNQPPIDFILVPSFNYSKMLPQMCRELSFLANATVVLVNANPKDPKNPPANADIPATDVFCCGRSFDELERASAEFDIAPVIKRETIRVRHADNRWSHVILFKLRFSGLNSFRHNVSGGRAKDGDEGDAIKPGSA